MKKFTPPWRDPIEDPPKEYTDVLVTNKIGSCVFCAIRSAIVNRPL